MASAVILAAIAALFLADVATTDMPLFTDAGKFTSLVNASNGLASQTFRSSDIVAPVWLVNSWEKGNVDSASHLFLGTMFGPGKAGPMIFDARDMSLVYADQHYDKSFSSDVRMINGTRHLTAWVMGAGNDATYCLVFDEKYNLKYNVTAQGMESDMHELQVTPEGTIVISTYASVPFDCSQVGGPRVCTVRDSGFQEIDPRSNQVLFNWKASEHFDLTESYEKYNNTFDRYRGVGYDYFHINSIDKTADGNYLVSSRNLCLIVLINGRDGSTIWRLGGRHNQFSDLSNGTATSFCWQHDARFHHNQSQITIFDNHIRQTEYCKGKCQTRGLTLELDSNNMTARVLQEYFHPERINSEAMGNMQALKTGNALLGYGFNPAIVEYTLDGTPVMDIQRGRIGIGAQGNIGVYRAMKYNWTGMPMWPPSIAIAAPAKTTLNATIYLSWNGATEVASWVILSSNDSLSVRGEGNMIAKSDRSGFETIIQLGMDDIYTSVTAAAVSASGRYLGYTAVIDLENDIYHGSHGATTLHIIHTTLNAGPKVGIILLAVASSLLYYLWR